MNKSYLRSAISFLVFTVTFITYSKGQSDSDVQINNTSIFYQNKAEKIDELVSTYAEYGEFNGSILISNEGEVIYKKGFGMANMEWGIPNQVDTKFRLASVTKQFTAMMIMQLVSENKLALDEPISTYLPTYPKNNGDKVNIHHLLTHTSGIPNYTSFSSYRDLMRNQITPTELVNTFADSTLQFAPGERFSYSNSGYVLLGQIIEKVTGRSIDKVLHEKILMPLKMTNTGFDNDRNILKNRANGYYQFAGAFVNSNYIDMSVAFTAGGMYTTVEDLFLWDQALYTDELLPKKYLHLIFDKHIPARGQNYGYGWNIGEIPIGNSDSKIVTIDHDGVINGFSSLIIRIPSDHSSIIILNNTGGAPLYEMGRAISGILYDKSYDFPKISIANSLLEIIKKEDITEALAFYNKVKDLSNYAFDENEMNLVGYDLLQKNQTKEAATVFKLNVDTNPNSSNAYDSYGEALMMMGDSLEAIENYKKSLKLNPKNENGIQMLEKLGVVINRDDLYLLKTRRTWVTEIIPFPLNFAKDINFKGTEEAHFPQGWRKQESEEFWSYVFAWDIDHSNDITESKLKANLQFYFDGLMNVVNKDKNLVLPHSIANIWQNKDVNGQSTFSGVIQIHDAFVTNKSMKLNVLIESHYCAKKKKSILVFRFSPKDFNADIWLELENIKLRDNICE